MGTISTPPGQATALIGTSDAPAVTATPALLAASGSVAIEGNNTAGKITVVVGGLGIAAGKIMSMTFNGTPPYKTGCSVVFTAGNASFANVNGQLYAITSKTGIDLYLTGLALVAGTYTGYYQVIGY